MDHPSVDRQPMWSEFLAVTTLLAGFWATWWLAVASPHELAQAGRGLFFSSPGR